MIRSTTLGAALFALTLPLRALQVNDPANLMGERVEPQAVADTLPINHGAAALAQLLLKLRSRASLMMIVAHPDDEDGGMLCYESRGQGVRVGVLTLTRGEGGQNLMSADFDDALGLIRTQELLAAGRYMGVDRQMFGTEVDFGFSKTKEESFKKWTHDRVLYDAVRAVRLYRPLVLTSVFVGGVTDGHGHHQVAGEITQEVFLAAADPKVFPEMIAEGLLPWAPLKVYARVPFSRVTERGMYDYATGRWAPPLFHNYVTGADITHEPTATVEIPEGEKSTALGMDGETYVQFARRGLALQKTQIGPSVRLALAGAFDVGYTLMASRVGSASADTSAASRTVPTIRSSATSRTIASARTIASNRAVKGTASAVPQATPPSPAALAAEVRSSSPRPRPATGEITAAPTRVAPPSSASATEPSLFTGIDTSLPGIATLAPNAPPSLRLSLAEIDHSLAEAQRLFDPAHLELTAPPLRDALRTLDKLLVNTEASALPPIEKFNILHELRVKRVELNDALVLAYSLQVEPMTKAEHPTYAAVYTTADPYIYTSARLTSGASVPLSVVRLDPDSRHPLSNVAQHATVAAGRSILEENKYFYRTPPTPTRPYFSRPNLEQPFYNVADPALRNAPSTPAPLVSSAVVDIAGSRLELAAIVPDGEAVMRQHTPPANLVGQPSRVPQPAVVIPPVSVSMRRTEGLVPPARESTNLIATPEQRTAFISLMGRQATASQISAGIVPISQTSFQIAANLSWNLYEDSILGPAQISPDRIPITLSAPSGWSYTPFAYFAKNTFPTTELSTVTSGHLHPNQSYTLTSIATYNKTQYKESFRPVGYPGLTYTNFYTPATFRAVAVDVTTAPSLRVAYLPGTGDDVPAFLPSLGVAPALITAKDLTPTSLARFDAVLLGVRAYNAHPDLAGPPSDALLAFAKAGGVVIEQYNTGDVPSGALPYRLSIPGDPAHNVVVEEEPVTLLAAASPLFTWPNRITSADFNGWVAERGHGFAASFDPHFQPLLEMHDPDQDPQRGGLLLAPVGKGAYIYCALALYRQLPEGVPGAYRLLANLLSYARNPHR